MIIWWWVIGGFILSTFSGLMLVFFESLKKRNVLSVFFSGIFTLFSWVCYQIGINDSLWLAVVIMIGFLWSLLVYFLWYLFRFKITKTKIELPQ